MVDEQNPHAFFALALRPKASDRMVEYDARKVAAAGKSRPPTPRPESSSHA
jgi:hypothetical protein